MTLQQRKKLAKAARELASLYAEGCGPNLRPYSYCGCVLGQVFKRAGIDNPAPGNVARNLEAHMESVDAYYCDPTQATFHEVGTEWSEHIPGAVVFPLLALADVLESDELESAL